MDVQFPPKPLWYKTLIVLLPSLIHLAGLNYFDNDGNFTYNINNMIERFVKRYYMNISIKEGKDYMRIK